MSDERTTFLRWCQLQSRRADDVGDFARDWVADCERPRAPTIDQMVDYLEFLGAPEMAVASGKRCYNEWVNGPRRQ